MRYLKGITTGVLILALLIIGISYSWTFTPLGRLDYQAAVFSKVLSWNKTPVSMTEESRQQMRKMAGPMDASADLAEGVRFEDREISRPDGSDLPVRIYWPTEPEPRPLYLEIHGGGWWMGDGYPLHSTNSKLAARSGAIVVAVEYRLAPEHPFPAPLDDCYLALQWVHENADSLGADPAKIAVGGGSAGGNLAAALTIMARDLKGPPISFQFLFVPATDLSGNRNWDSYRETEDRYMLKVSDIPIMIEGYVPNPEQRLLPTASPLLAPDHENLPTALIVTAQFDPLRDQGEAYADALQKSGVAVTLIREQGSIHGLMGSQQRMDRIYALAGDMIRNEFTN